MEDNPAYEDINIYDNVNIRQHDNTVKGPKKLINAWKH